MIEKKWGLASHRILELEGEDVAVIAEAHNAWAILDLNDLDAVNTYLQNPIDIPLAVEQLPAGMKDLWDAGLLTFNGAGIKSTERIKEKYPSSLLLKLTGACNISCNYCYDYDMQRWKRNLTMDQIAPSIDFLLKHRDHIGIVFHGGEPLLRFDIIEKTVDYVNEKIKDTDKKVSFQIQTNGLLFNDKIVSFLEEHQFSVGLSIDGMTEESNILRPKHNGISSLFGFAEVVEKYSGFIRDRCGILTVVSIANLEHIVDFALWLQSVGINSLSLSFLDVTGKGAMVKDQRVKASDAVWLFEQFVNLIRNGTLKELNFSPIMSRISNLFQYHPRDFCHKGPCAASDDFLVLDAEGTFRTCDCVYHPFFEIGKNIEDTGISAPARDNITDRHTWLKTKHVDCKDCAIFSFCGGTCAAKAIAANNNPYSIDAIECALSKYIFPELLKEFIRPGKKPLFDYYNLHKR